MNRRLVIAGINVTSATLLTSVRGSGSEESDSSLRVAATFIIRVHQRLITKPLITTTAPLEGNSETHAHGIRPHSELSELRLPIFQSFRTSSGRHGLAAACQPSPDRRLPDW